MNFRIVITYADIRLRQDSVQDFVSAYGFADMSDLEEHLEYSQFNYEYLQAEFSAIPDQFESDQKFYEAYLARIKEIAAPMTYQLH
jgi:hypothetical protein